MLHKYASESKWDDAIRLCRFVKVKVKIINDSLSFEKSGYCVEFQMSDKTLDL